MKVKKAKSNGRRGGRKAAQGKTQSAVGIYLQMQGRLYNITVITMYCM